MLRKYIPNPELVIEYEPLGIEEELTYEEKPIRILDCNEQVLHTMTIPIVKVLWRKHGVEEASLEAEHDMRNCYSHLFEDHVLILRFLNILLELMGITKRNVFLSRKHNDFDEDTYGPRLSMKLLFL